jgi:3-phenylpropionate/trans-cinnamate dioxygenase ferredoxin reductase subunit
MVRSVPEPGTVVVAGAGQAGYQTVASLRQSGFEGRLVLVGNEPGLPYQRPPLSKAYLSGKAGDEGIRLRAKSFYDENAVELRTPEHITGLDRQQRQVRLDSGESLPYDHLVLALGARNRELPVPGADLDGVVALRTVAEAESLRKAMSSASTVAVIGAGFIGLEFAAAASDAGLSVTVVEALPRVMSRAVSEPTSEFFQNFHESRGVRMVLGVGVSRIVGEQGVAVGVETSDGAVIDADLVVVGVGVRPNVELAEDSGVRVDNGVVVDEWLRTSDPDISAVGDCASFPCRFTEHPVRLESVQNAVDQARCVAHGLTGTPQPYGAVPWFWTDQGAAKLQIAGITDGYDRTVVRGAPAEGKFSVFCYRGDRLLGAESVGRAADHMAVRRILHSGATLDPAKAVDPDFDLKAYGKQVG